MYFQDEMSCLFFLQKEERKMLNNKSLIQFRKQTFNPSDVKKKLKEIDKQRDLKEITQSICLYFHEIIMNI